MLSVAGEIIGLGNVWRFPYLCYKNGGGVFFIPYFTFLIFCGIPVFFLETAMGQYTSESGVTAWRKMCPMFQGIGYACQVIVVYLNIYYIVVLAWAIFYLMSSFNYPLPWSTCDNWWNTENCVYHNESINPYGDFNSTLDYTYDDGMEMNYTISVQSAPELEYWLYRVLRVQEDSESLGNINWDLALCLLAAWVLCYFCVFKGIKTTGKGIKYFLIPNLDKITSPTVWRDAGTQVFFSIAVDCLTLCCLNSATSIFAGFTVFSVLGFMAHEMGVSMDDVLSSGPGLVFIAYPRALSMLPGSSFWAVLFFLMVLFLGLDSQFVCVESLATAITDLFPRQLRRRGRRELLVLAIAVVCFLLGLPLITQEGIHLFEVMDTYGPSGVSLLFIAGFETVVIGWVYGADRFLDNIEDMIGYRPFPVLKYCWLFVTPVICVATMMHEVYINKLVASSDYQLSTGMSVLASLLVATPLMCIPLFIAVALFRDPQNVTTPSGALKQAKPQKPILTLCHAVIFRAQDAPGGPRLDTLATDLATGV
ncbi:hypothetical protein NHX12_020444 [Muraenolepis orangiensis]|uniref:Transporter n=1 Tax=Muraenolepis orangiensis TaxID=630683 RepID=A0A9Q0EX38_9TELE|nr:hypothetical protein NHX12_020444 [Muraenolepis orangiensis]